LPTRIEYTELCTSAIVKSLWSGHEDIWRSHGKPLT
jgi:hypothetical protein